MKQTKDTLKTFFKNGEAPPQEHFWDLIDSVETDLLSEETLINIANGMASIDRPKVVTSAYNIDSNNIFKIVVAQENAEDQALEFTQQSYGFSQRTIYLKGDPTYVFKAKEFSTEGLSGYEYYYLYTTTYNNNAYNSTSQLFGNTLPNISNGSELLISNDKNSNFNINLNKINIGRQISVLNTNIKIKNNTEVPIAYKAYSPYWQGGFKEGDSIANHYSAWDRLYFQYRADTTQQTKTIICRAYNDDTNTLLMTGYLTAKENHKNTWGGGSANAVRNIRIECNYQ